MRTPGRGRVGAAGLFALFAPFAGGCHAVVAVDRPPNSQARAVLLVLARDERAVAVRAIDAADPDWSPLGGQPTDTLYAVSFSCEVTRLGLEAGIQQLSDDRAPSPLTPPPAAIYARALDDPDDAPWTANAELPAAVLDALGRLPLPPEAICRAVGARYSASIPVIRRDDQRGEPAYAFALDDDRVLAGTRNSRTFLVHRNGTATELRAYENNTFRAGVRGPDGAAWLIDELGGTWTGTLEDGFHVVTSSAPFGRRQQRVSAAVSPPGAPLEIYAVGVDEDLRGSRIHPRTFRRFDGTAWTALGRHVPAGDTIYFPAAAWIAPGEAVGIGVHPQFPNGVLRQRDGRAEPELLPGTSGPASILHHPLLGTLVGRDDGEISMYVGGRWAPFGADPAVAFVRAMLPEDDGFLYAFSNEINFGPSAVGQYQPSIGFCSTFETYTDAAIFSLTRMGDDVVVAMSAGFFGGPARITLLRRTQAAASCSVDEPAPP